MRVLLLLAMAIVVGATTARARDYCPDRPGIYTPPCVIDPGKLSFETSLGDWTHQSDEQSIEDTVLIGDLSLRYGIAEHTELRFGWTPYGHDRTRDRESGEIDRLSGTGDVTLGIKRNLIDPTGKQLSIALLPQVTLPSGGRMIGSGDWGAGLLVPVSVPLGGAFSLIATPEIDAAVDEDRHGRHLAYGTAGGVQIEATKTLNIALEGSVIRDDDPSGHETQALFSASAGLMLGEETQIDMGAQIALNQDTPDRELYFGLSRRF